MTNHFINLLSNSGLIEKHNNLSAEFVQDISMDKDHDCIYLMTGYFPNFSEPLIKIGISKDPVRRLYGDGSGLVNHISAGCAFPIFIDFILETRFARDIERNLHNLNDRNRLYNPDVFNGNTEWFVGVSLSDLKKDLFSIYESFRSKVKGVKHKPNYKVENIDYSGSFNVDNWGIYEWFFKNSPISEAINRHKRFQEIQHAKDMYLRSKEENLNPI